MIYALIVAALTLTCSMFHTRQKMLGFPCGIFWALFAAFSYQQSTVNWDLYYLLFFSSSGMSVFCMYAAFGLRRSDLSGPDADKGKFIDEGDSETRDDGPFIDEAGGEKKDPRQSRRTKALHKRAEDRRTGVTKKRDRWGEFR